MTEPEDTRPQVSHFARNLWLNVRHQTCNEHIHYYLCLLTYLDEFNCTWAK